MRYRLETIPGKKLVGKHIKMSFADNKTAELWRNFMPRRKEILNNLGDELISLQVYPEAFDFHPNTEFEKWAAVEVSDFDTIPAEMETFHLPGGLYAVFLHKGSSNDNSIFRYIFTSWLPVSDYILDNRPHFEVLGEKYKNQQPDSEEEIWIPINSKSK